MLTENPYLSLVKDKRPLVEKMQDGLTDWIEDEETPQAIGADSPNALLAKVSNAIAAHSGAKLSSTPFALDLLEVEIDRKLGARMAPIKIGHRVKWVYIFQDMFGP